MRCAQHTQQLWRRLPYLFMTMVILMGAIFGVPAGTGKATNVENLSLSPVPDFNKIAVFADPHYFDPELGASGAAFEEYLSNDRKMLAESDAIVKETIEQIKNTDAGVVLIPGDLTKDGEKTCHEKFAALLADLEDCGKKVYVIDGNHDIYNPGACRYVGDQAIPVDNLSPGEFKSIYSPFGYAEAIAEDPNSLSYVVEPVNGLRIIAMDSAVYGKTEGAFSADTLNWIKDQISAAKLAGKTVLGMMHHNLIDHFSVQRQIFPEYVINDADQISSELAQAGMNVVFTGHFHAQDVVSKQVGNKYIYDIENGSLVTYPSPYRLVELTADNKLIVTTSHIESINYDTGGKPFPDYAKEFLVNGLQGLIPQVLAGILIKQGVPPQEALQQAEQMANTVVVPPLTINDLLADAMVAHYQGDESVNQQILPVIQGMASSADSMVKMLGGALLSIWFDPAPEDNNLTIIIPGIELDVKPSAMPGEALEIKGNYIGEEVSGVHIAITVKNPNGALSYVDETSTGTDGSFGFYLTIPANAPTGLWTLDAAGGGCAANKTFSVSEATGMVNVSPASVKPGGVVTISGTAPQGNVPVGITIKDPNGSATFVDQTTAGAGGGYTFQFTVPASAPTGTWTADVAGGGSAGRAAFTVASGSSSGGGSASPCKQPAAASYLPQTGASNVALDAEVSVIFDIAVSKASTNSLNGITITDEYGNKVGNVAAVLSGTKLTLSHDAFEYNTKYTVTIPEAVLANSGSGCSGYHNKSTNWSFTTLKKTEAPSAGIKAEYTDVPSTHWAFKVITELGEKGIITGYPDGSFKPDSSITRAEFVAILGRALGWEEKPGNPAFSDAAEIPDWARGYILRAVDKGVVGGYEDNSFRANQPITRLEIVIIIVRALGQGDGAAKSGTLSFSDAAEIPDWAANDIAIAVEQGIATGKPGNVFAPNDNATRAEAASLVARMLSKL